MCQSLSSSYIFKFNKPSIIAISKDDTVILDGASDKKALSRKDASRSAVENSTSYYDKEKLQERLAKLFGGVRDGKITKMVVVELPNHSEMAEIGGGGLSSDLSVFAKRKFASVWWKDMCRLGVIYGDGGGDWCQDTMVRKLGSGNVIIFGMIFGWIQSLLALFSQGYSQCRLKRSVLSIKWVAGRTMCGIGSSLRDEILLRGKKI
ncbi:unnamed protein product [Trifolium pratense]|uniref:Uncharacterized protein n=1 Tax=Trifolium pratense TaxID=57577 RepID=A0ACB0LJN7_TRIPR|nr:unnamed protein product [Trifolium pratense]